MAELIIRGLVPTGELVDSIYLAADVLGIWECYALDGRYHFTLGGGWSLALAADSAGRIRVETCRLTRPVSTMWTLARRRDRLAGLIRRMSKVSELV